MIARALKFIRAYFALIVVGATFAWSAFAIAAYRARGAPPGAIVIRLGHWQLEASVRDAIYKMAEDYRREVNPNVYIMQDAIPEGTYGQWVSTQLMGGTAPDLLQVSGMLPFNIWFSYYQRYFIPLGKYVELENPHNAGTDFEGVPLRKTYKDGMKTAYVDEMQEYVCIPLSQFGTRIFYNRDLLRQLTGLEEPPTEYRAFLEVCEKIRVQRDPQGKFYIPIAGSMYHFGMMGGLMWDSLTYRAVEKADFNRDGVVGNNEQFVAFRTGRLDFDFLPYRARFKMIEELTRYFQSGYTGLTRDEAVFLFAQQKAVFMSTGTWDARSLQEQAKGQFEVGVMYYPYPEPTDPYYGPVAPARPREQVGPQRRDDEERRHAQRAGLGEKEPEAAQHRVGSAKGAIRDDYRPRAGPTAATQPADRQALSGPSTSPGFRPAGRIPYNCKVVRGPAAREGVPPRPPASPRAIPTPRHPEPPHDPEHDRRLSSHPRLDRSSHGRGGGLGGGDPGRGDRREGRGGAAGAGRVGEARSCRAGGGASAGGGGTPRRCLDPRHLGDPRDGEAASGGSRRGEARRGRVPRGPRGDRPQPCAA